MNELPTPITRKEQYLAKAAGDNSVVVPDPITREEQYLNAIAQGGGSGGGSDLPPVTSADNGDLLGVVNGAWSKTDPPYSVTENTSTVIAEQSVETALMGAYGYGAALSGDISGLSDGDSCVVSFNGTDYTLEARVVGGIPYIGEADFNSQGIPWVFTTYPFFVADMSGSQMPGNLLLLTEEAESCTISVVAVEKTITPNSDFTRAVNAVGDENVFIFRVSMSGSGDNVVYSPNVTYSELQEQQSRGKQLFASVQGSTGLLEMTGDSGSAKAFTTATIMSRSNRYELWQGGFVINSDDTVETLTTLKFTLTEAT